MTAQEIESVVVASASIVLGLTLLVADPGKLPSILGRIARGRYRIFGGVFAVFAGLVVLLDVLS